MDVIIMCAGLGTRLRPITNTIPKPLVPIAGKGSLERTLEELPPQITRVILVVNYLAEQIQEKIGSAYRGRPVIYVRQDPLDGTGGCLRVVMREVPDLSKRFMVINGDDLYSYQDLVRLAEAPLGLLTIEEEVTRASIDSWDVKDGRLVGLKETKKGERGLINIGAYLLDQRWFETQPTLVPGKASEWSVPHAIPQLLARDIPFAAIPATYWRPVGTPEELERVGQELRASE